MKRCVIALLLLLLGAASAYAGPPYSGIGTCPTGQVVNRLNANAPPSCVVGGGGGGGANLNPYNGAVKITGNSINGTDFISGVCHDGVCPASAFNIVCDGMTDNNPSGSGPLQTAINTIQQAAGVGTGELDIPPTCNAASGHRLLYSIGITIPPNVCIVGLAGPTYPTSASSVQFLYTGNGGTAVSANSVNAPCLKNIWIKNGGTGTPTGLDLAGTFAGWVEGVSISGFTTGLVVEDSASSSGIYNVVANSSIIGNGTNCVIQQTHSTKSANSNVFVGTRCTQETANNGTNLHITGTASNENVFDSLDVSQGTGSPTGILVDAGAGRGTQIQGMTAEGLGTVFNLGVDVRGFKATGVDGGFFNGFNGTPITADGTAQYQIGWSAFGSTAAETDLSPNSITRSGYYEAATVQDPTAQVALGRFGNAILQSEAFTNASWVKVNPTAQTITDGTATLNAPGAPANAASTVAFAGNSLNAYVRQSVSNGGSIQNTCFTFSESFQVDSSSTGTLPPYFTIALQDGAAANQEFQNYPLSTTPIRASVTNCFPTSTQTSVLPYALNLVAANNTNAGLKIDIWGAQLTKTTGPVGYAKTTTVAVPLTVGVTAANLTLGNPLTVANGGSSCAQTPTLHFAGLPGSPPFGTTCTIVDCVTGASGSVEVGGGVVSCQVTWLGSNWVDGGVASTTASGPAGGDLTGTYPNPTLTTSGATAGTYSFPVETVDVKGRITSISNGSPSGNVFAPTVSGGAATLLSACTLPGCVDDDRVANGSNTAALTLTTPATGGLHDGQYLFVYASFSGTAAASIMWTPGAGVTLATSIPFDSGLGAVNVCGSPPVTGVVLYKWYYKAATLYLMGCQQQPNTLLGATGAVITSYGATNATATSAGTITGATTAFAFTGSTNGWALNQGIMFRGGAASTLAQPSAPTPIASCASTCTTTFNYEVVAIDSGGGYSKASTASAAVSNNALTTFGVNLTKPNVNVVVGAVVTNAVGYLWYRSVNGGAYALFAVTQGINVVDFGQSFLSWLPAGLWPAAPPGAVGNALFNTTISALVGTAATLAAAPSVGCSSGCTVYHDNTAALQNAIATNMQVQIPQGTYYYSGLLTLATSGQSLLGSGTAAAGGTVLTDLLPGVGLKIAQGNVFVQNIAFDQTTDGVELGTCVSCTSTTIENSAFFGPRGDYGDVATWQASTVYALGTTIQDSNGNYEQVTTNGTSNATAPTWPLTIGGTVTDNTVTWTMRSKTWTHSKAYTLGAVIQDYNGNFEQVTTAGTSGVNPPNAVTTPWPTTVGTTTADNTVTWTLLALGPSVGIQVDSSFGSGAVSNYFHTIRDNVFSGFGNSMVLANNGHFVTADTFQLPGSNASLFLSGNENPTISTFCNTGGGTVATQSTCLMAVGTFDDPHVVYSEEGFYQQGYYFDTESHGNLLLGTDNNDGGNTASVDFNTSGNLNEIHDVLHGTIKKAAFANNVGLKFLNNASPSLVDCIIFENVSNNFVLSCPTNNGNVQSNQPFVATHLGGSGGVITTVTGCGTGPTLAGTDINGSITAGTTPGTCILTYRAAYNTAPVAPVCFLNHSGTTSVIPCTTTASQLTFSPASLAAGDVLYWATFGN